ncbi:helix-turn-helix domain-containing protein [Actinoplanes sp. NPDC051633]|uniref:helix-turn-helix transcriptional regulator n=1 Tax=Actinoplanes sp. NPDC051633 TaxID=3155670 RepID=UPI00342A6D9B
MTSARDPHRPATPAGTSTPASPAWNGDRIRALGTVTDVPTAAQIFRLSRSTAYDLVSTGDFPVPVLRFGHRYRIAVAAILDALHLPHDPPPTRDLTSSPAHASIVHTQSTDPGIEHTPPERQEHRHE